MIHIIQKVKRITYILSNSPNSLSILSQFSPIHSHHPLPSSSILSHHRNDTRTASRKATSCCRNQSGLAGSLPQNTSRRGGREGEKALSSKTSPVTPQR